MVKTFQKLLIGPENLAQRILVRNLNGKSLKRYIFSCTCYLKNKKTELKIIKLKVKRRDFEYFSKCIGAQIQKDHSHAILYASECLEMRKLFKIVFRCELVLEQIIIRLETLDIFSEISYIMIFPVTNIIEKVRNEISEFMPKISYDFGIIIGKLEHMASKTKLSQIEEIKAEFLNESSSNILEEAKLYAEKEVRETFPNLPKEAISMLEMQ